MPRPAWHTQCLVGVDVMTNATTTKALSGPSRPRVALRPALKWGLVGLLLLASALVAIRWATARPDGLVHYETVALDRGPIAAKVTATGAVSALEALHSE